VWLLDRRIHFAMNLGIWTEGSSYLTKRTQNIVESGCRRGSAILLEQQSMIDMISRRPGRHLAILAGYQSEEAVFGLVAYDGLRHRAQSGSEQPGATISLRIG
jgi:hypothetical protein